MVAPQVAVIGLKALSRDIGKLSADRGPLNKAMSAAGRQAAEPVAALTRSRLPQDTGRLAGDVRVTATRSGAGVRMGRNSIRYAGWVEFGGTRKAPHRSTRPYDPRGRYLFPAALTLSGTVAERYSVAVNNVFQSYPWSNQTNDERAVHD